MRDGVRVFAHVRRISCAALHIALITSSSPVLAHGAGAVQVDAYGASVVVCGRGNVVGTGVDDANQIGDGTTTPLQIPIVDALEPVRIAAVDVAMNYTLALAEDGTVWGWGWNERGQLGGGFVDGTSPQLTPVQAIGLTDVVAVAAGSEESFALKSDGTVWSWGRGNATPMPFNALSNIVVIASGSGHTLALDGAGKVWAWGKNNVGQVGNGTTEDVPFPVVVPSLTEVVAISAGNGLSVAVRADGTVWTWGQNNRGQLGIGTVSNFDYRTEPVQALGVTNAQAVDTAEGHVLALTRDGAVWGWGDNYQGQLGRGFPSFAEPIPAPADTAERFTMIAAGIQQSLALDRRGKSWRWGDPFLIGNYDSGLQDLNWRPRPADFDEACKGPR